MLLFNYRTGLLLAALFFLYTPISFSQSRPVVAIVIDDIGYQPKALNTLLKLPYDITFAVLPEAPYSQAAMTQLKKAHKEIILHLPMQGSTTRAQEKTVLTTRMDKDTFTQTLRNQLNELDGVSGVNNHQGSQLTKSARHMVWLMSELNSLDGFYFLDSRTSGKSMAYSTAQAFGIPSLERDVFLDHESNDAFINKQFNLLIRIAKKRGSAIGIGHPHSETVRILKQRLPELKQHGIDVVFVSELIPKDHTHKE